MDIYPYSIESIIATIFVVWSLPWKGYALWRAARREHLWWFVVLLLVQTVGLLEIVYIFGFSNRVAASRAKKSAMNVMQVPTKKS